jgi:hypothetical protein
VGNCKRGLAGNGHSLAPNSSRMGKIFAPGLAAMSCVWWQVVAQIEWLECRPVLRNRLGIRRDLASFSARTRARPRKSEQRPALVIVTSAHR